MPIGSGGRSALRMASMSRVPPMTLPWMDERIQLRAIASLRPHAGNQLHPARRSRGTLPCLTGSTRHVSVNKTN